MEGPVLHISMHQSGLLNLKRIRSSWTSELLLLACGTTSTLLFEKFVVSITTDDIAGFSVDD